VASARDEKISGRFFLFQGTFLMSYQKPVLVRKRRKCT